LSKKELQKRIGQIYSEAIQKGYTYEYVKDILEEAFKFLKNKKNNK